MRTAELLAGIGERLLLLALGCAIVGACGLFGMRLLGLFSPKPEARNPKPDSSSKPEARVQDAGAPSADGASMRSGFWFLVSAPAGNLRPVPEQGLGRGAEFVLGAGLGLGTLILVTLGLGCAGLLSTSTAVLVLAAMLLVGIPELREIGRALRRRGAPGAAPLCPTELILVLFLLCALAVLLIMSFNLPVDYDACEYHMAAPARWFQRGGIDYVPGNVYSNFPMNCEMLYLFSMTLTGDLMVGTHLGVVMNALTAVLAAAAVFVTARRFFTRRAAFAATALFATMPWLLKVSVINIYNEMALTLFATLAMFAFLEFAGTRLRRWCVISAVFAGLAGGAKYTALAFFPPVLAVCVILVAGGSIGRRIGMFVLFGAVAAAVFAPWAVKSAAMTGNPVYPFAWTSLGGRDWSADLDAKWIEGQVKAAGAGKSGNFFFAIYDRVIANLFSSLALFGFLVLGLFAARERPVRWLLVFLVLYAVYWYFFTHRVDRFFLPMLAPAAALAGRGFEITRRRPAQYLLGAALILSLGWYLYVDTILVNGFAGGNYDLKTGNARFLKDRYKGTYPLVQFSHTLDRGQRLMLVGEAQSMYLRPDTLYSTVFNEEVFTSTVKDVRDSQLVLDGLRRAGVTHLFVNWFEIGRLRATYAWTGADGKTHPGFPPITPMDFERLVTEGVLVAMPEWNFGKIREEIVEGKTPEERTRLTAEEIAHLPARKACVFYAVNYSGTTGTAER
jgi:hypothetical protein